MCTVFIEDELAQVVWAVDTDTINKRRWVICNNTI